MACFETNVDKNADVDPLSYLNRNEFTSEKYKIEIRNLPKLYGYKDVHNLMSTCGVVSRKIKMFRDIVYVTFSSESERSQALESLDNKVYRGSPLKVKISKPAADPYLKRQLEMKDEASLEDNGISQKNMKLESKDPFELMCSSVTPLSTVPYEKQLEKKRGDLKCAMRVFERELLKAHPGANVWLEEKKKLFDLCCNFLPVIPSPITKGYRNKCEFSIGTDLSGNRKTVGFRLSSYKSGEISVIEPKCNIVSEKMQSIVCDFQTLIRQSDLEQYCVVTHSGHWRGLTVRSGLNNRNIMIIVHFSPQQIFPEDIQCEKDRIYKAMSEGHSEITSFYWNSVNSISSSSSEIEALELLGGDAKISEKVLSSTFRLSPTAFFQVNTLATELLYSLVCDWAGTSSDSTVMDVCCGTGTVGIILAKSVHKVIGIEMSQDAIHDAKENAAMNNLNNIQYHCGKAEEVLPLLAESLASVRNVSAVVDPPRCGLHKIVIQSLRKCSFLTKLVYVSCNAKAATTNWVDLCRPTSKKFAGAPFQMVKAQPVDLFPHTNHCELVVLFERPAQPGISANKKHQNPSVHKEKEVLTNQQQTVEVKVENEEFKSVSAERESFQTNAVPSNLIEGGTL